MKNPINVLVVIDQTIERKGLSHLLNTLPAIAIVGEAASGKEAVDMARESHPDVILLNQELFQREGLNAIWRIWQDNPGTGILVLSASEKENQKSFDYTSGELRFAHQSAAPEELALVIQAMSSNGIKSYSYMPNYRLSGGA